MNRAQIILFFLALCLSHLPLQSMGGKSLAKIKPTQNAQADLKSAALDIPIGEIHHIIPLANVLNHIFHYFPVCYKNKKREDDAKADTIVKKIVGLHYYAHLIKDKSRNITQHGDWTQVSISSKLSIWTVDSIYSFHKGWIVYKGELYPHEKTFFPCQWTKDDIIQHLHALNTFIVPRSVTSGEHCDFSMQAQVKSDTPFAIKDIVVTPLQIAAAGRIDLPDGLEILTIFPLVPDRKDRIDRYKELQQLIAQQLILKYQQHDSSHTRENSSDNTQLNGTQDPLIPKAAPDNILRNEMQDPRKQSSSLSRVAISELLKTTDSTRIQELLQAGADPHVADQENRTPLMLCAKAGATEAVLALLEAGVSCNAVDKLGRTVACYALQSKDPFIALTVLTPENSKQADTAGCTPLMIAVQLGMRDVCQSLVYRYDADINAADKQGRTALMFAAQQKGVLATALVKLLLNLQADTDKTDAQNLTALHYAVMAGNADSVEVLLRAYADHTIIGARPKGTALELAQRNYDRAIEERIKTFLADEERERLSWIEATQGNDFLFYCYMKNEKAVAKLLACNEGIAHQLPTGETALHFAVSNGWSWLVDALLARCSSAPLRAAAVHLATEPLFTPQQIVAAYEYAQTIDSADKTIMSALKKQADLYLDREREKAEGLKKTNQQLMQNFIKEAQAGHLSEATVRNFNKIKERTNKQGETPLLSLVRLRKMQLIEQLCSAQVLTTEDWKAKNNQNNDALLITLETNDQELLMFLLKQPQISSEAKKRLIYTALSQNMKKEKDLTEFLRALAVDFKDIFMVIFKVSLERPPSLLALHIFDKDILNFEEIKTELFFEAVTRQNSAVVERLLQKDRYLSNITDDQGRTALMIAAQSDNCSLIHVLCSAGADPLLTDNQNRMALYFARNSGLALLREKVAQLEERQKVKQTQAQKEEVIRVQLKGYTPLMIAAYFDDVDAIAAYQPTAVSTQITEQPQDSASGQQKNSSMLQAGGVLQEVSSPSQSSIHMLATVSENKSHIDSRGINGLTALMIAVQRNNIQALRALLAKCPHEIAHQDNVGKTALVYAIENDHGACMREIIDAIDDLFVLDAEITKVVKCVSANGKDHTKIKRLQEMLKTRTEQYVERINALQKQAASELIDRDRAKLIALSNEAKNSLFYRLALLNEQTALHFLKSINRETSDTYFVDKNSIDFVITKGFVALFDYFLSGTSTLTKLDVLIKKNPRIAAHVLRRHDIIMESEGDILGYICNFAHDRELFCAFLDRFPSYKHFLIEKTYPPHASQPHISLKITWNTLSLLIDKNKLEYIDELLKRGFNPNELTKTCPVYLKTKTVDAHDSFENTQEEYISPLMLAIEHSYIPIVEKLLEYKADINWQTINGMTALMKAVIKGNLEIIDLLLKNHADPLLKNKEHETALTIACLYGRESVVERLLKAAPSLVNEQFLNEEADNPLLSNEHQSKADAEYKCLKSLHIDTPLLLACYKANKNIITLLLDAGAHVNAANKYGLTPLLAICKNECTRQIECARLLIQAGAKINIGDSSQSSPLLYALSEGNVDLVTLLLENGADLTRVDKENNTPLLFLANLSHLTFEVSSKKVDNDFKMFQLLLNHKADVNAQAKEGDTALMSLLKSVQKVKLGRSMPNCHNLVRDPEAEVVAKRLLAMIRLLLNCSDLRVDQKDNNGDAAIHFACWLGDPGMVEKILSLKGANVDVRTKKGKTPLMLLPQCANKHELFPLLFERPKDFDQRNSNMAYNRLMQQKQTEIALILIKHGAEVNAESDEKFTPLMYVLNCHYIIRENDNGATPHNSQVAAAQATVVHRRGDVPSPHIQVNEQLIECLIRHGANVNACMPPMVENNFGIPEGITLLMQECGRSHKSTVELLLKNKADIHRRSIVQDTALHIACNKGDMSIVSMLLAAGADINARNEKNKTPLAYALEYQPSNAALIQFLKERGAQV